MYRVQYYCVREGPIWQEYKEGLIFKTPRTFADFAGAQMLCNSLIWRYHSARVIDPSGQIIYQV